MKRKILIIILIVGIVALTVTIFLVKNNLLKTKNHKIQSNINLNIDMVKNKDEPIQDINLNTETTEVETEDIIENEYEIQSEKPIHNSSKVVNNSSETIKEKENNQTILQEQNPDKSDNQESGMIDPNGNIVEEEKSIVIISNPWEQLGISEFDWYHKPVYSWMRVDYDVSNCNSISNCERLCMNDAEELAYIENVSCIQVHTYSGNYLGEMLKRN